MLQLCDNFILKLKYIQHHYSGKIAAILIELQLLVNYDEAVGFKNISHIIAHPVHIWHCINYQQI